MLYTGRNSRSSVIGSVSTGFNMSSKTLLPNLRFQFVLFRCVFLDEINVSSLMLYTVD